MSTRIRLAPNGPEFSRLALGFWRLAEARLYVEDRLRLLQAALEAGITTMDHADIYGGYTCEELFGEALSRAPHLRARMEIVSKCGICLVNERRPANRVKRYDTSRAHIVASVENSLRSLRTDHLDLLLIHRPDPFMDADATAAGLTEVVAAGKVRHVGVSNFSPSQFDLLQSRLSLPLVTNQVEVSPLHIQPFLDGTLDHLQRHRISAMAWSPFAGGRLFTGTDEAAVRVRSVLEQVAAEIGGASVEQTVLAWLLSHPARLQPVLGTMKAHRIHEALPALNLRLSTDQWYRVWIAACGRDVP